MRKLSPLFASTVIIATALSTPAFGEPVAFEVASIKAAQMGQGMHAGGGQVAIKIGMDIDAGRVQCSNMSLMDLLSSAYKVKTNQISGPDWIRTERFDIFAKIPDGVSTDRVNEMMQRLLEERFKLVIHHGEKEQPVYALVVGKSGMKLKESAEESTPSGDGPGPNVGGGVVKNGTNRMTMSNGKMQMSLSGITMSGFVDSLSRFLDRPVLDKTELTGRYDMELDISQDDMRNMMRSQGMPMPGGPMMASSGPGDAAADPSGPNIFTSVQQFGLKLESRKAAIETIFVDRAEKTPTEN